MRLWYSGLPKKDPRRKHQHYRWSDARGLYFADNFAGPDDGRKNRPRYDIPHPVTGKPCKKPSTGWRWDEDRSQKALSADPPFIHFGPDETTIPCRKSYLKDIDSEPMNSVFYRDGRAGTLELEAILGGSRIEFPKDKETLSKFFEIATKDKALILDYFAGSGTTGHAVFHLNRAQKSRRRFVLVEMGNHFDRIMVPRLKRLMYSESWSAGKPNDKEGYSAILKVQSLEQYEDLLDNLIPVWDDNTLPLQVPVSYLFRPEQNALSATLDLSRPFAQTIRIGKTREEKTIDLMETWCYLQGYWIKSRRLYREFDRPYLAVETTHGALVVFRDIDDGEDDTANLNAILAKYADEHGVSLIRHLEVNHDADQRRLVIETTLITAADFMRGVQWN